MSKQNSPKPQPQQKPKRDYSKALGGLSQLEDTLLNDKSPLVAELKAYMAPYDAAAKSGQISKQDYMNIGGQFAQDWVNKNLFQGEGIPTEDELKGPILEAEMAKRAQLAASDPRNADLMKLQADQPNKMTLQDQSNPYGPLSRQAGALAALSAMVQTPKSAPAVAPQTPAPPMPMPKQPNSPKLMQALKAGVQGMSIPTSATTDDGRLGEAQLMMLQQLAGSMGGGGGPGFGTGMGMGGGAGNGMGGGGPVPLDSALPGRPR